tara:strand:+ start:11045 stop:11878 length:834 start_codon:yes stop_codon:yes gene_type:complete
MNSFVFVSDFFAEQIVGGGELNDYEVCNILLKRGQDLQKINSHLFTKNHLDKKKCYIISNFINLKEEVKNHIIDYKYIIYEHDHKYIKTRNPALYKNFIAPKEQIVNEYFYKNAIGVLCQSRFHTNILKKNLNIENIINLSGNVWSIESLEFMRNISNIEKQNRTSILKSNTRHKNTSGAINYCISKNEQYDLISDQDYHSFLSKMGKNRKFVFLPKTPETLSRICVEARMMNMSVAVNSLIGASKEKWYALKGEDLINHMIQKRDDIVDTIIGLFQ